VAAVACFFSHDQRFCSCCSHVWIDGFAASSFSVVSFHGVLAPVVLSPSFPARSSSGFFFSSQRWRDGLFMLLLLFSASFLALFVCSLDFGFLVCFQIC
jgi:hypothetical protein